VVRGAEINKELINEYSRQSSDFGIFASKPLFCIADFYIRPTLATFRPPSHQQTNMSIIYEIPTYLQGIYIKNEKNINNMTIKQQSILL